MRSVTLEFRLAEASDMDGYFAQAARSFHRQASRAEIEHFSATFDLARTRVAVDDGRIIATLRSQATQFTVPGPRTIPASALTNVSVAATHRRQGILSTLIAEDLRDSAARGEVLSILIASEYPIYGRYGYGPAIESASYRIDTTGLSYVAPEEGHVEISDLATLRREGPVVYERCRTSQPGAIERDDAWWDLFTRVVTFEGVEPRKGFCARYVAPDGTVEGYLVCEGKMDAPDMRHEGVLTVNELMSATPRAYRALWKFCTDVDLLTHVVASNRAVGEPIGRLFDNARGVHQTNSFDFIWIRILDVVAALEGRSYTGTGRVVLEVDDDMGIAAGRFELNVDSSGARCSPTTEDAELRMPISALGSIYVGDVPLASLVTAGAVQVLSADAANVAARIFRSTTPSWCATWF